MAICTRTGCGKTFDENSNNAGECMFHPGGKSFSEFVEQNANDYSARVSRRIERFIIVNFQLTPRLLVL
jgi:hypothetical protein